MQSNVLEYLDGPSLSDSSGAATLSVTLTVMALSTGAIIDLVNRFDIPTLINIGKLENVPWTGIIIIKKS